MASERGRDANDFLIIFEEMRNSNLNLLTGSTSLVSYPMNFITPIDLPWTGRPRSIAAALLRDGDFAALIDPVPSSTLPRLREQLAQQGLAVPDLQAIFLTHIHLDHAGATGSLVKENHRLRVYVHGKGAPHLIAPTKLLESSGRLFGADRDRLFGDFLPVPESNVQILEGGAVIPAGSRALQMHYSPGHASHHVTYFEPRDAVAFVGDTAGICVEGDGFVLPAMPPPDVSMELWDASLDMIRGLNAGKLFLTHFGFSRRPQQHIDTFRQRLHWWNETAQELVNQKLDAAMATNIFSGRVAEEAARHLSRISWSITCSMAHCRFRG
jgi:glyoxylase-like metal-dependent hydrolase (beta-lactamase superfamily II)